MRVRETLRLTGGSTAVYIIVAACSAAGGGGGPSDAALDADGGMASHDASRGHDAHRSQDAHVRHDAFARHDAPLSHDSGKHLADVITHPVSEASADPDESGSRLKTERYAGTDGSSVFVGMYDSMLHTECAFTGGLSDGSVRCVPSKAGVSTGLFFADSTCGTVLASVTNCGGQPPYATVTTPATSCSSPAATQVFAITGPWTGLVYFGTPASCSAAAMSSTSTYAFYSLGPTEVPPSAFVAGTLTTDF